MQLKFGKSKIISLLLFFIVLFQNSPWFVWSLGYTLIAIFAVLLFFCVFDRFVKKPELYFDKINLIILAFLYFIVLHSVNNFRFSSLVFILVFISLLVITNKEKAACLCLFNRYYVWILLISFSGWFIHSYIYPLPDLGTIQYVMLKDNAENIVLKNHGIFIRLESDIVNRFYSVFDEPGVVGTLNAFLLYINGFNLRKKYNWVYLITGIFTYSFAFIILALIGIVFVFSKNLKQIVQISVLTSVFSSIIYLLFKDDNTFQLAVLNRAGAITEKTEGRTSIYLNNFFEEFIVSKDAWFGKGTSFYSENWFLFSGGQSYKIFLIEYGVIGFLLILALYLSISISNKKVFGLLLLFCVSFIQRPFMFTPWELVLYSVGVSFLVFSNSNKSNNFSNA